MAIQRGMRRAGAAAMVLLTILLAGCGEDATGPGDGTGTIVGTVSIAAGESLVNGRIEAYTSYENLQSGTEQYQTALTGGPSQFTFRLEGVAPGLYLLAICGNAGALESCEAVSTDGVRIREFEVRAGQTVTLNIRL